MAKNKFKISSEVISKRSLYIVLFVFVMITFLRLVYFYTMMERDKYEFAKEESKILSTFMMVHRTYYQNLFISKTLILTEKTLPALPAFSALKISNEFSLENTRNMTIQTVSDKARNDKNMADSQEYRAIEYFRKNRDAKEYYNYISKSQSANGVPYYQYAQPLKITQKCMICHGKKEDAPDFIRNRYDNAYDYKLGELRGILSIKVPESGVESYFAPSFRMNVLYDLFLFAGLFFAIRFLIKKFQHFSGSLEKEVQERTVDLEQTVSMLDEYKKALENSAIVSKSDANGNIMYVNDAFCKISGYTREELIGKNQSILRPDDVSDEFYGRMWEQILNKQVWHGLIKNVSKEGRHYYEDLSITPIIDNDGEIKEFIAIKYDVTELIEKRKEIQQVYTIDKLTSLPNRSRFIEDVGEIVRPNIALINIDGFKNINDYYGIASGDALLKQVAEKLRGMLKHDLFRLYRLHADEFAILGKGILEIDEFVALVHHYEQEIEKTPFMVTEDQDITFSVTIGFGSGEQSLVKADMALKVAKTEHKEYFVYDETLNLERQYEKNILMVKRIKSAIEENRIVPYFQPILHIASGSIEKYESLVRMEEGGDVIPPGAFLPVAKQTKQYFRLSEIMIEKVMEAIKNCRGSISVNLSMEDFSNEKMMDYLKERLENFEESDRLIFEILESEAIDNYDALLHSIKEIKQYGVHIAIDDFGSGYSNFTHVLQLAADFIKIDGSLIRDIDVNQNSRILVEGIIDFSKRLQMKTIAEFVENEEILNVLREIGVDYAQGYYIGKPLPDIFPDRKQGRFETKLL